MHISDAVRALDRDLHGVFGGRLRSVVAYAAAHDAARPLAPTMVVVDHPTADDLRSLAAHVAGWHDAGLATPLLLAAHEFARSLDAFPFEFGAILANHAVVSGANPFEGLHIDPADLRQAAEVQARSHLIHLREGYIETAGRGDALADLITRSATALAPLVTSVARLIGEAATDNTTSASAANHVERAIGAPPGSLGDVVRRSPHATLSSDEARRIFPAYLNAIERLTVFVDQWHS
jgi:hypothetical protein